jgi:hypothetical protein
MHLPRRHCCCYTTAGLVKARRLAAILTLLLTGFAQAATCDEVVTIHCGSTPTSTIATDGMLLTVFVANDHIYFTRVDRDSLAHTTPVRITHEPMRIDHNGESRPKIALGPEDSIFVSWTERLEARFSGDVHFSRSLDGGETFEAPRVLRDTPEPSSHRFDELAVTPTGRLYALWIDKRDIEAAEARGDDFAGASIYYSYSDDLGATFSANQRVVDHSCECCRMTLVTAGDGGIRLMWRHVFDGSIRDHALIDVGPNGPAELRRVSHEDWELHGCPHQGPHMAKSPHGLHMAWFSGAPDAGGVHYGFHDNHSGETRQLAHIDDRPGASKPQVAVRGDRIDLIWLAVGAEQTVLLHQSSSDAGHTWSGRQTLISSTGDADNPQVLQDGDKVWVAWHTRDEGFQLLALPGASTEQP